MNQLEGVICTKTSLSILAEESPEERLSRLIQENPVVILSQTACCMCHVTKRLLSTLGVNPVVIESDPDYEALALSSTPAVFVGGQFVGGIENLMGLHVGNRLVPILKDAGAIG